MTTPSSVTRLVFALHFHQPFGNLDRVFADACDRCYEPTIALLAAHEGVKFAAHVSGPLLDWLEDHRPKVLDSLAALVERGQAEILGGGDQEPMLAILPDRDAVGQLVQMADRCEQLLGARPKGMWLAERVWEPDLARVIAQGGYGFTLLDDTHLRAGGVSEQPHGHYVTEKAGHAVGVFPIDRGLRQRIPFADVSDLMGYLASQRGRTLTYGDDTEKFGLWPSTEKRVWQQRWLERWFEALAADDGVETVLPSHVLAEERSRGLVYIPTISYAEMGAWTLPPEQAARYDDLEKRLRLSGMEADSAAFLRGGIWQAFLAKYPESRLIHRKMLRVSAAVAAAEENDHPRWREARRKLYQGQCNCAYWHGLFGGLYLQHLRGALMGALLEAEALLRDGDAVRVEAVDHDGDLRDEVLFEGPAFNAYVAPDRGASVFELDLVEARFHLTGVLGRRLEAYHRDVARAQVLSDEELENVSAHDLVRAREPGLADRLRRDAYPRGAFVDLLLDPAATPEQHDRDYRPLAAFAGEPYESELDADAGTLRTWRESDGHAIDKTFRMRGTTLEVEHSLSRLHDSAEVCFASELSFTLLSPDPVGGRALTVVADDGPDDPAPGAAGVHHGVREVRIAATDLGIDVTLELSPPAELWRMPLETVSQSEAGFERAYQGTALVFAWRAAVGPGAPLDTKITVRPS